MNIARVLSQRRVPLFAQNFKSVRQLSSSVSLRNPEKETWISDTSCSALEPTFKELGLGIHGSYFPNGILQSVMENVHLGLGVPWWETIAITTVLLRSAVFPIIVKTQKNMVHMAKHQPEITRLQQEALKETDPVLRQAEAMKIMNYMQENKVFPLRMFTPIFANGVVMASMFFAIRGLTNFPLQSMTSGGMLWFENLTVLDPTYALPALASLSVLLQIQLGADGMSKSGLPPAFRNFMYIMPLFSFTVMTQFPSALCLYWLTSNIISLLQSLLLRIPSVKKLLKIPV